MMDKDEYPYWVHRVVVNSVSKYPCIRIDCPICEALTEATRAEEFIESQLDWTW